jgi:hypothetical protein
MFLRGRLSWKSVLGLLVLAALGYACYLFFTYPKGPVTVPEFELWVDGSLPPNGQKPGRSLVRVSEQP